MQLSFEKSLKPMAVEEFVDYYFFRRIAYCMVPTLLYLGVSPNTVTSISLVIGLIASLAVLKGLYVAGAVLAVVAICFDCCDGQVARLTGKTSPTGRLMDGFFDLLWGTALWLAVYNGPLFDTDRPLILGLMAVASASMILHCWSFDGVKIKYLEVANPEHYESDLDIYEAWAMARKEWHAWRPVTAFFALLIALQGFFFIRGRKRRAPPQFTPENRRDARNLLAPVIRDWTWLGEGHHNVVVILGLFFAPFSGLPILMAFGVIAMPMNLWWLWCTWRWHNHYRQALRYATST